MVLSTGRVLEHWHTGSMTRRAGVLDALEPEAVVFLAPRELHRLDLEPGDTLKLETRRGAIEVKVRADGDVPVGMVFMPFCYAEAAANLLTNPALDPTGKIPEFKFCAAACHAGSRGRNGRLAGRRLLRSRKSRKRGGQGQCALIDQVRDGGDVVQIHDRHAGVREALIARDGHDA